ncbi:MAG TPA: hypothetical protein VK469_14880 [Candidatus Kapabacteria bacterium]|nr:hypothetical protein [Candidatus Kapabacteria bacterium]
MEEAKEDFKILKNEILKDAQPFINTIYCNCDITGFQLENSTTIKECLFIDCHLKCVKMENLDNPIRFTFLNCRISDLHIKDSYVRNIRFFNSEILNSLIEYSNLPGMIFSKNFPEELRKKQEQLLPKSDKISQEKQVFPGKRELDFLSVYKTEFLFCQLNSMKIDNTKFTYTDVKHCIIEELNISENVEFQNIDLRGSKFKKTDFGVGSFKKIKFTEEKFLIEWVSSLLVFLGKVVSFFFLETENIKKKIMWFRYFIKKILYKCKLGFAADLLSSTNLQDIVEYKNANFPKEYNFLWHIQDLDFISHYKTKHRVLAKISFWTSNYLRSFLALAFFSLFVVYFFSWLYSKYWTNLATGQSVNYFYLSFKIFSNFGIYYKIDGCASPEWLTKIFIIIEIIIGYFALGTLLSIILFPFTRKTSLPGK